MPSRVSWSVPGRVSAAGCQASPAAPAAFSADNTATCVYNHTSASRFFRRSSASFCSFLSGGRNAFRRTDLLVKKSRHVSAIGTRACARQALSASKMLPVPRTPSSPAPHQPGSEIPGCENGINFKVTQETIKEYYDCNLSGSKEKPSFKLNFFKF